LAIISCCLICSELIVGGFRSNQALYTQSKVDGDSIESLQSPRCATVRGFSVHANVGITALDRVRLERLARYAARPAVSTERLSELPDGRLLYRLKRRWRNGTTEVVFDRSDFIAKLAALVPAPRAHLRTYHGILAPAAKWRPWVVPSTQTELGAGAHGSDPSELTRLTPNQLRMTESAPAPRRKNYSWSALLKRIFDIDISLCERCGGPVRVVAAIQEPETVAKILDHLGLPSRPPPTTPARYEKPFSS
jgi:hypothetical protein